MKLEPQKKEIIFIVGLSHSGSSIVARIYNTIDSSLNIGEVVSLNRYAKRDTECSCGKPISRCPFWQSVPKKDLSFRKRNFLSFKLKKIIQNNKHLYEHIFNYYSQIKIVIDNSKHFLRAVILSYTLKDKYNFKFIAPHRSFSAMYKSLKKRKKNTIKGIDQKYPFILFFRYPVAKLFYFILKSMVKLRGYEFMEIDMNNIQYLIADKKFNLDKVNNNKYKINDYLNHSIGGSISSRDGACVTIANPNKPVTVETNTIYKQRR